MYYIVEQKTIQALRNTKNKSMINLARHFEQGNPDVFEIYAQIELYTRKRTQQELTNLFLNQARWFEKSALFLDDDV